MHPNDVATDLLEAFNTGDLERMRGLLAPDLVAWVTNADGDADRVIGRDEYLRRVAAMDLPSAQYRATLTQSPAAIDEHLVLLMVEIRAERNSRRLHNFAAHVLRVDEGRVIEWRMADAKPARATSSGPDVALHRCSAYLLDLFRGFRRYGHAGPAGTLSPISTSNADSFDALIVDPRTRGPASGTAAAGLLGACIGRRSVRVRPPSRLGCIGYVGI